MLRRQTVLFSFTLLAAPVANECTPKPLPCEVQTVFKAKCQSCHANPLTNDVPMPLVTYADTQAPAASNAAEQVWQRIRVRIESTVNPMPPAQAAPLTQAERDVLRAWLAQNAPPGTVTCAP
ncbi:MAG TPA: c-type cytochrome [Polyangiaceae bacterium]|nr:c-type cytochrome [Polyangiaceae bacterium]